MKHRINKVAAGGLISAFVLASVMCCRFTPAQAADNALSSRHQSLLQNNTPSCHTHASQAVPVTPDNPANPSLDCCQQITAIQKTNAAFHFNASGVALDSWQYAFPADHVAVAGQRVNASPTLNKSSPSLTGGDLALYLQFSVLRL